MTFDSEYFQKTLGKIVMSTINRRMILGLKKRLFEIIDIQPKNFKKSNLEEEVEEYFLTKVYQYATVINKLFRENKDIYMEYFMRQQQGLATNVRNLLLEGEESLFREEVFYCNFLNRLLNKPDLFNESVYLRYFQRIYEFIIFDVNYNGLYNLNVIEDDDSDSEMNE